VFLRKPSARRKASHVVALAIRVTWRPTSAKTTLIGKRIRLSRHATSLAQRTLRLCFRRCLVATHFRVGLLGLPPLQALDALLPPSPLPLVTNLPPHQPHQAWLLLSRPLLRALSMPPLPQSPRQVAGSSLPGLEDGPAPPLPPQRTTTL
jgi:hypothetical protein